MVLPIVAIGASAGGLEAISELLEALPPKSAMAYVVVQHLDPDHRSLLSEILAKKTAMPVEQIHDGLGVRADHVYVIPPNTALTLSEERCCLTRRTSEGPHHPVDVFFSSLADARGDAACPCRLSEYGERNRSAACRSRFRAARGRSAVIGRLCAGKRIGG